MVMMRTSYKRVEHELLISFSDLLEFELLFELLFSIFFACASVCEFVSVPLTDGESDCGHAGP